MYTREEESNLKKQFWTGFGQYISPVPSASGNKINWINYKTGVKAVRFRMDAGRRDAYIAVEISHTEDSIRKKVFEQFKILQAEFERNGKWDWEENVFEDGKKFSRISRVLASVNVCRKDDWQDIAAFLKAGIISLDQFWVEHKDIFEMLS